MKLFVYSTKCYDVNKEKFSEIISKLPEGSVVRTSGSDMGIEPWALEVCGKSEIFIPWQNFNGFVTNTEINRKVYCPAATTDSLSILDSAIYGSLKPKYLTMGTRLIFGVLGRKLDNPVDAVIINETDPNEVPITSAAVVSRLAQNYDIPVYNLNYMTEEELMTKLYFK